MGHYKIIGQMRILLVKFFFWSYTHLGQEKITIPKERPFNSAKEMDQVLIQNWNSIVSPNDTIYHLGDFSFNQSYQVVESYLKQLNGKIILISGNHDEKFDDKTKRLFSDFHKHQYELQIAERELYVLNHHPMLEWNKSHHNSFHLFGHCHGVVDNVGKTWDVGVDNNNFFPISLEEIRDIMKKRPDNRNFFNRKGL